MNKIVIYFLKNGEQEKTLLYSLNVNFVLFSLSKINIGLLNFTGGYQRGKEIVSLQKQ